MDRDPRYLAVKLMVENGSYKCFQDIFRINFPKTILARYLGTNNNRMSSLISRPRKLTVEEVERISLYFDVRPEQLLELIRK